MLSRFRRISIHWDGINNRINEQISLVKGGGGRIFAVTVTSNGQVIDSESIQLAIKWEAGAYGGRDVFERANDVYELVPPKQMVRNTGSVRASLELFADGEEPVTSMPFTIHIQEAI